MPFYIATHPVTGAQATRTSDRPYTHAVIGAGGFASFAGSLQLAHQTLGYAQRQDADARVVALEVLAKKPKAAKPAAAPAEPAPLTDAQAAGVGDALAQAFMALQLEHAEGAQALAEVLIDHSRTANGVASLLSAPLPAPPTTETYAALQQAYDWFNARLFQGRLPQCLITLQRREERVVGYFWPERFISAEGEKLAEIAMNPVHFGLTVQEILATLVHEMTHAEQHQLGTSSRAGYHNAAWGALMLRVGLCPSDTGKPGGKQTGQKMNHYPLPGGPFEVACAELLADGAFQLRWREVASVVGEKKKKKPTRSKYVCPDCGLQMWGKPASKLICGECEVPMPEQGADEGEEG